MGEIIASGDGHTAQLRLSAKRGNRAALKVLMWDCLRQIMDDLPAKEQQLLRFLRNGSTQGTAGTQKRIITVGEAGIFVGVFFTLGNFGMFVLLSALLPCICMMAFLLFEASWQTHVLELVLSGIYLAILSAIVFLAPRVWRFHCFTSLMQPVEEKMLSIMNDGYGLTISANPKVSEASSQLLTLKLLQRAYSGWITGCQVQRGLAGKLGPWIPALVHSAGRQGFIQFNAGAPVRPRPAPHNRGYARSIDWQADERRPLTE